MLRKTHQAFGATFTLWVHYGASQIGLPFVPHYTIGNVLIITATAYVMAPWADVDELLKRKGLGVLATRHRGFTHTIYMLALIFIIYMKQTDYIWQLITFAWLLSWTSHILADSFSVNSVSFWKIPLKETRKSKPKDQQVYQKKRYWPTLYRTGQKWGEPFNKKKNKKYKKGIPAHIVWRRIFIMSLAICLTGVPF